MNMKYFLKSFFPILLSNYWFVTTFIVLFLLIPFLKILLKNIEKSMFQKLLLVLAILLIIPVNIGFGNVDWFIFLFFISAYIKRYSFNLFDNNIKNLTISVIMYVIIFLSIILFNLLGRKFSVFLGKELFFIGQSSPFILITSIFLFQFFKNLKIENKVINEIIKKIAITTFGIYLIHDNFIVRKYLWIKLFKNSFYKNSNFLFLHSIISILLIFIFCFLVDILLQKTVLKIFYKIENKITVKMITYFSKFYNYYENKSLKKIQISSLK
ncbi:MAG: acyltransferase family protein [Cetobacterium sp.]